MTNNSGETGEPCGVPTATGANTLGDPWYRRRHVLPVRKDLVQETRYGLTAFALSMLHRVEGFTLSNPPLMSRKSVETFLPAIWRVLTSWVRVVVASEVDKPWGRRGRRGPYIDFADAVHFDDCESSGLYKQGMRLRVYRHVVM